MHISSHVVVPEATKLPLNPLSHWKLSCICPMETTFFKTLIFTRSRVTVDVRQIQRLLALKYIQCKSHFDRGLPSYPNPCLLERKTNKKKEKKMSKWDNDNKKNTHSTKQVTTTNGTLPLQHTTSKLENLEEAQNKP